MAVTDILPDADETGAGEGRPSAALTGDPLWLERAQAFAMHAIEQCRMAREQYGRGRYSLWTGDIGLACYLHECVEGSARFPTIDVF